MICKIAVLGSNHFDEGVVVSRALAEKTRCTVLLRGGSLIQHVVKPDIHPYVLLDKHEKDCATYGDVLDANHVSRRKDSPSPPSAIPLHFVEAVARLDTDSLFALFRSARKQRQRSLCAA